MLYLIFNEGYTASAGDSLTRRELASEAIRLARTLCKLLPNEPENVGLLALMLLQDSRRAGRASPEGELQRLNPSAVVALNAAVAVAMNDGLEKGLADMEAVGSELDGYYLYHAARADLLRRLHRSASALDAYRKGSRSPPTLWSAATCAAHGRSGVLFVRMASVAGNAGPKSTARSRANIPVV